MFQTLPAAVPQVCCALCASVSHVSRPLRLFVPHVPCALRAYLLCVLRALVSHVSRVLRVLVSHVLSAPRALSLTCLKR